jgi:Protein of unknown function (DUF2484)
VVRVSLALAAGCLWVLAAAVTAMLPYRRQFAPGITLLTLAPVLIGWIGWVHGWLYAVAGLLAFGSMFRRPLIYLARWTLGLTLPDRPKDDR